MSVILLLIVFSFSHCTVCVTKLQKHSLERMCSGTAVPTNTSHKVAIEGNQRYLSTPIMYRISQLDLSLKYICIFSLVNIQLPCACEGK